MALLNCSNCGESITDEDVICPHCGCPNYLSDEPAAQVAVEKKPAKRGRPSTKKTKEVSEEVETEEKDEEEKIEIVEDDDEVKPAIEEIEENDFEEEPQVIEETSEDEKDESQEIEESEEEPKEEEKKEFKPVEDINEIIGLTEKKTVEKEETPVIEESNEDNEPQDTEEIDTEEENVEEENAEEKEDEDETNLDTEDDYDEPKHEDDVVLSIEEDKPEESEKEIEEEVPEVVDHKIADSYNDIIDESKYEESEEDKHRHIITAEGLLVEYNNKGEVIDKLIQEEKIGYEDAKKYVEMASEKLEQRLDALKRKSDKKLQETVNQEYISELKKYIDKMESDKQAVNAPTEEKEDSPTETNEQPVANAPEESALTVFIKNNPKVVLAIVLGLLFIALLLIIL